MLLTMTADQFVPHFLHFLPPIKNTIIPESIFSRIIYSPPQYAMQGVYLTLPMTDQLGKIEAAILAAYASPKAKITSLHKCSKIGAILKISGIWETDAACGLAYKFIS